MKLKVTDIFQVQRKLKRLRVNDNGGGEFASSLQLQLLQLLHTTTNELTSTRFFLKNNNVYIRHYNYNHCVIVARMLLKFCTTIKRHQ